MTVTALYRKTAAAFLVCILLLTTVVQLSHSHKTIQPDTVKTEKTALLHAKKLYSVPGTDSRCFLCEYQLVKDADLPALILYTDNGLQTATLHCEIFASVPAIFNDCSESRGPPACNFI